MASTSKQRATTWNIEQIQNVFSGSVQDVDKDKSNEELDSNIPLETTLENEDHLFDLHTHLLGMGNTGFWIDSIIDNHKILPKHSDFFDKPNLGKQLCPLIWNSKKNNEQENAGDSTTNTNEKIFGGFIDGARTSDFFDLLIKENFPGHGDAFDRLRESILDRLSKKLADNTEVTVFRELMNDNFIRILKHYNLFFGISEQYVTTQKVENPEKEKQRTYGDFTYDVVLTLDDFGKALGVTTSWMVEVDDLIQSKVEEKLGLHTYQGLTRSRPFRLWIVFNAREQKFQVVKGMTVEILRDLITVKANAPSQACALARAHLQNAFSMCNPDGTDPRPIDFDRFQGSFTPEFYPRRFSLKDSIYSQRLDVLASLLVHVLRRYQCCLPPIRYCELSIGVSDLCSPWVFDILRSFPAHCPITKEGVLTPSSFCTMIQKGHFPHLRSACSTTVYKSPCIPNVTYKFLAGFNRQKVRAHHLNNQLEAIRLLNDSPDVAIHYMLEEIVQSEKQQLQDEQSKLPQENNPVSSQKKRESLFDKSLEELENLEKATKDLKDFKLWVVGLDLFGDEMGYPYCPFVTWPFRKYIRDRRHENKYFGLRIHCGENVPFAYNDVGAYRHFIAHMYIAFRCLRFLKQKLQYGIRVGHGIAFARILSETMSSSTHRKSSVLLAEMKEHAKYVLENIVFEINITSNEYLLGQALREGCYNQTIRLSALTEKGIPIILATDDDGIWPIDHCPSKHPGHHSLVAEYCRAISLSLITSHKQLRTMLHNTNKFCFYILDGVYIPPRTSDDNWALPKDGPDASTIIFHPDLIKTIMKKYYSYDDGNKQRIDWGHFYERYRLFYRNINSCQLSDTNTSWEKRCDAFALIAYVAHNTTEDPKTLDDIRVEFALIFPNNHDLDAIYAVWINCRKQFMFPNDETDSQHIITDSNDVFLSESSYRENQTLSSTLHFAKCHKEEYRLQVFSPKVSELDTSTEFNNTLESLPPTTNMSATVYTTKNKDEYINPMNFEKVKLALGGKRKNRKNEDEYSNQNGPKKVKLTFNEKPTNRTNFSNVKEEHMLYVISRHASAATAYLHYFGNQLVSKYQQSDTNGGKHPEEDTELEPTGIQTADPN